MAYLFSTGIASLCAALASSGQYDQACNKAVDAGTRQTGIRQTFDGAEDKSMQVFTQEAESYTPKPIQDVAATGVFVYRAARNKKVELKLPTMGVCDSMSSELTPASYALTVRWYFP